MRQLILVIVVVAALAVVGGAILFFDFISPEVVGEAGAEVFLVEPGPFSATAKKLKQQGFITDARLFTLYSRFLGKTNQLKVGEYSLMKGMGPGEILDVITSGKSIAYPITFSEGLNMYEIGALLEAQGLGSKVRLLQLAKDREFIKEVLGQDVPSLEGYLFPNTYNIAKNSDERDLVKEMVRQFRKVFDEVWAGPKGVKLTPRQTVVLASIIEKETGVPEERTLVSSVFHNRLRIGMLLQTDPTVLYGMLDETGIISKNIRKSDLLRPTRYNTYTQKGLPYGPISNPGRESLAAALNPASSEYLYFVSRNDGTHVFTSTYKDHSQAVREYQLDRKQRQGKSWRDYSKKKNR